MIELVKHIYTGSAQEFPGAFSEWLSQRQRALRDTPNMEVVVHSISHCNNDHYIHYEIKCRGAQS